ncbi:prepilin-type N-terminal cleavage/methylation domain-containing protein [Opitutales bacterium]|nr:prepilin-type N-terminal cleavage/methylation domain-containing protein [Opitutales bacterium]
MINLKKNSNLQRGFSLLELLVVLAVMGVMMGLLGFSFLGSSSTNLGLAQRNILSLVHKARFLAMSSGLETRIIVNAENSDSEKYLRYAEIITLDRNSSFSGVETWLVDETSRVTLPEDIWFVADGIESDNAEWASNGLCIWSASLEEDDFLLSDPAKGKRIEEVGVESARYHYLSCNAQGVFLSPTYPAMPRLAFAKGSLTPRAGGSLSPTFVNQQDIAGIQFQPFGGIVMMEFQDFDYE